MGSNYSYGAEVTFKCKNVGYTAVPADATCMADGSWSMRSLPTCRGELDNSWVDNKIVKYARYDPPFDHSLN